MLLQRRCRQRSQRRRTDSPHLLATAAIAREPGHPAQNGQEVGGERLGVGGQISVVDTPIQPLSEPLVQRHPLGGQARFGEQEATGRGRGIGVGASRVVEHARQRRPCVGKRRRGVEPLARPREVDTRGLFEQRLLVTERRVEARRIDPRRLGQFSVTDPAQVAAAAATAGDVHVLINNAGISTGTPLVTGDEESIRREMDTNFYGPLRMIRAFAPVLARQGGGAIVNVVSALSWFTTPMTGAYAASKAAAWALTDSARLELAGQATHVVAVHMGLVDTDMSGGDAGPKITPGYLAGAALDAVESGAQEVLADEWAAFVKAGLTLGPAQRYEKIFGALGS